MDKLHVLLVEGASSARHFIKFGVEKNHSSVIVDEAVNIKEAWDKMQHKNYAMVICNWNVSPQDAPKLLATIRKSERTSNIPFIMTAEKGDRESLTSAMRSGANDYIMSPFTIEGLLLKMAAVDKKFDRRKFERFETEGDAIFYFRGKQIQGSLLDISTGGVFCLFQRSEDLPSVFDSLIIDIRLGKELSLEGLTGFVIRFQAADPVIDAAEIKIAVKFMNMSARKTQELENVINSIFRKSL